MPINTMRDRNFKKDEILIPVFIDRPELQHWSQRGIFGVIAACGLTLWLYLFMPLLTLLAWVFGYYRFDQYIIHDYQRGFSEHLTSLIAIIMIMGLILLAWASYNILRFYKNERRRFIAPVQSYEVAEFFELSVKMVEYAQQQQVISIVYDKQGKMIDVSFGHLPVQPKDLTFKELAKQQRLQKKAAKKRP